MPCNNIPIIQYNIEIPKLQCVHTCTKWCPKTPKTQDWLTAGKKWKKKNGKKKELSKWWCVAQRKCYIDNCTNLIANEIHCFRWHFHSKWSHCRKFIQYNFVDFFFAKENCIHQCFNITYTGTVVRPTSRISIFFIIQNRIYKYTLRSKWIMQIANHTHVKRKNAFSIQTWNVQMWSIKIYDIQHIICIVFIFSFFVFWP